VLAELRFDDTGDAIGRRTEAMMGDMHVGEYSPGFFWMYQGGLQVGQMVVVSSGSATVEYYYLYASGQGQPPAGYGVYTWPGPQHTAVTTSYSYKGTTPSGWNPQNPSAYKTTLQQQLGSGLTVQYIECDCSAPSMKGAKGKRPTSTKKKKAPKKKAVKKKSRR